MANEIDYRDMLQRYMRHVYREEGATFVVTAPHPVPEFSIEESKELWRMNSLIREVENARLQEQKAAPANGFQTRATYDLPKPEKRR